MQNTPTPDEFPVCEGCGERHAPVTPEHLIRAAQTASTAILAQARRVVEIYPGEFPDLEDAIGLLDLVTPLLRELAPMPAPKPTPAPSPAPGFYL